MDSGKDEFLTLIFIYSDEYAERVIRNLINDPIFCRSCGLYCDSCKYGVYSYVRNIRAAIRLPDPMELPALIDDSHSHDGASRIEFTRNRKFHVDEKAKSFK